MANTAQIDALLKEEYGPAIREQLDNETPLLDLFEKAEDSQWDGAGKYFVEPIHVGRNRSAVAVREGGGIPTAGKQTWETLKIKPCFQYGGISLNKQQMKATSSSKGSFARIMKQEMDGLLTDMRMNRNRMMGYDGRGILGYVNGDPGTATTITVDTPGGVTQTVNTTRFIHEGMLVAFIDPATQTIRTGGSRTVATVPATGLTFTITAAANAAVGDNDYIVQAVQDSASLTLINTTYLAEPMGILGMVDDGTYVNGYFGLSRTDFPILKSQVFSSVGALSADILQRAVDVSTLSNGKSISAHLMDFDTRRAYLALAEADRRYTLSKLLNPDVGTNAMKGGYDNTVDVGGVPLKCDWALPSGTWFGFQTEGAQRYVADEGSWIDEDGSVLQRSSTVIDQFDANYRLWENFAHLRPNACFRLDGITTNVVTFRKR